MTDERSADDLWLDAMEARQMGETTTFNLLREKTLAANPEHPDALMSEVRELFRETGPKGDRPTKMSLADAAIGLRKCRTVLEIDPERDEAWVIGGRLLVDELGMFEEALSWWDDRRMVEPREVIPLVEQIAILTEFGEYAEAADRIDIIFADKDMESPDPRSMMRLRNLSEQIKRAAGKDNDFFQPQDPDNDGWIRIKAFSGRKPTTETYWLFFFVMPLIWIEAILINRVMPATGFSTMILGFMIIFASFLLGSRWVKSQVHKLNRPAHELTRAINAELTSGLLCIPEPIRKTKLYSTLRERRAIAAMNRHDKIVENGDTMSRKWKLSIPEWNEFVPIIDDDDDDDGVIDEIVETVSEVIEDLSLGSMTSAVDTGVEGAEDIMEKFTDSIKEKV